MLLTKCLFLRCCREEYRVGLPLQDVVLVGGREDVAARETGPAVLLD